MVMVQLYSICTFNEVTTITEGAKFGALGSVNMRRIIAFSCLLQAEECNFLPHIHGTRSADFSPPLYINVVMLP